MREGGRHKCGAPPWPRAWGTWSGVGNASMTRLALKMRSISAKEVIAKMEEEWKKADVGVRVQEPKSWFVNQSEDRANGLGPPSMTVALTASLSKVCSLKSNELRRAGDVEE